MVTLANESSKEHPLPLHTIAENEEISTEFLQQIFYKLRQSGLIAAIRGPGGGFYLAKSSDKITVLEILEAAGECMAIVPCSETRKIGKKPCMKSKDCKAGKFWISLEETIRKFATEKTLGDIAN
jgi:Rrf2 family iron-sulfur cluster assembly transcriptional regulator